MKYPEPYGQLNEIYSWARRFLSVEDAEDFVQEAYMAIARGRKARYYYLLIDYLRKHKYKNTISLPTDFMDALVDPSLNLEEAIIEKEIRQDRLCEAFSLLSHSRRRIMERRARGEYLDDIAQELNVSESNVSALFHRSVEQIRAYYQINGKIKAGFTFKFPIRDQ